MMLENLADLVEKFPEPRPTVVLGGQAWKEISIPESVPAVAIDMTPSETVGFIEKMMQETKQIRKGSMDGK